MAAKKNINKTQFVKSLSKDLSAKEVVKKAKDAGIVISEAYVYTIRSAAGRAKKKSAGSAPSGTATAKKGPTVVHATPAAHQAAPAAKAAAHTTPAAKAPAPHAAPAHKSAKKSAKKAAKKAAHKAPVHVAAHKAPAPAHHTASGSSGASERHFVELVADIGLHRAQGLLTQFRGQVHNIKVS
jgi:hypothetical protein